MVSFVVFLFALQNMQAIITLIIRYWKFLLITYVFSPFNRKHVWMAIYFSNMCKFWPIRLKLTIPCVYVHQICMCEACLSMCCSHTRCTPRCYELAHFTFDLSCDCKCFVAFPNGAVGWS